MINRFSGPYEFLSNFWYSKVILDGEIYPSVEHAYQAAKTKDLNKRKEFQIGTPGDAKKLGRKLSLREDWENIKIEIMLNLLRQKFNDPQMRIKLLSTKPYKLEEGNNWGDTFWGVCNGQGDNHLGKLLMKIRDESTY